MAGLAFFAECRFTDHLNVSPTPLEDIPLESISIIGDVEVIGLTASYDIVYNPTSASKRGVLWSIDKGSEYASISDGILTVLKGADGNMVTIKATAQHYPDVYAVMDVSVTYHAGSVSPKISTFCARVLADGGKLLKSTEGDTQICYTSHTELLGVEPVLDWLGYKEVDGKVTKLYSVDGKYDCESLTNIVVTNGKITTTSPDGKMLWDGNMSGATGFSKLYWDGPLVAYGNSESVFIGNLLGTKYIGDDLAASAVFYKSNTINAQYAANIKDVNAVPVSESLSKILLEVDSTVTQEGASYLKQIFVDDIDLTSKITDGIDYWRQNLIDQSYVKIYSGFNLILMA